MSEIFAEAAVRLGATRAALMDIKDVVFDRVFRQACAANSCGKYGKCWMCPPDVGDIDVLMAEAQAYEKVILYQTVGTLEDSYDFEGMMEAGEKHHAVSRKLEAELRPLLGSQVLHLSSGGCRACQTCAKEEGKPCRSPEQAMASLEAYGVAVSVTAGNCGLPYINGQDTVTYFGAFLYK